MIVVGLISGATILSPHRALTSAVGSDSGCARPICNMVWREALMGRGGFDTVSPADRCTRAHRRRDGGGSVPPRRGRLLRARL